MRQRYGWGASGGAKAARIVSSTAKRSWAHFEGALCEGLGQRRGDVEMWQEEASRDAVMSGSVDRRDAMMSGSIDRVRRQLRSSFMRRIEGRLDVHMRGQLGLLLSMRRGGRRGGRDGALLTRDASFVH